MRRVSHILIFVQYIMTGQSKSITRWFTDLLGFTTEKPKSKRRPRIQTKQCAKRKLAHKRKKARRRKK
jgi:hypothetical protein